MKPRIRNQRLWSISDKVLDIRELHSMTEWRTFKAVLDPTSDVLNLLTFYKWVERKIILAFSYTIIRKRDVFILYFRLLRNCFFRKSLLSLLKSNYLRVQELYHFPAHLPQITIYCYHIVKVFADNLYVGLTIDSRNSQVRFTFKQIENIFNFRWKDQPIYTLSLCFDRRLKALKRISRKNKKENILTKILQNNGDS